MKAKSWGTYLIYSVLIIGVLYLKQYVLVGIQEKASLTFEYNFYRTLIITLLFHIGIGFLLGLESFIGEFKKSGKWKINVPKIIVIVLPAIYFSCSYFLYFSSNQFIQTVIAYPVRLFIHSNTNVISIFQIIIGYFVTTSLYKQEDKQPKDKQQEELDLLL